jgi:hypothetical protein
MNDRDLDKIIDKWVDDETASAPELRPTAEMYEQVVSLGRKRPLGALPSRRGVWMTAGAALTVFVLVYTLVYSSVLVLPGMGQPLTQVPQRVAFASEKGPARGGPPPKGPRVEPAHFRQLVLEIVGADPSAVRSVDVLASQLPRVLLTGGESYRLVLEPAADRWVYVYQQSPSGALVALHPNEAYSSAKNPARAGETVYLPDEPNGFYLGEEAGAYRLYVVASEGPVSELETLYEQYSRAGIRFGRWKSLDRLVERMDALVGGQTEGASGWTFEFEVR